MPPATLALGGKDPATLEGRFDDAGYSLHLSGNILPSRLRALAAAVPQFGDGLNTILPPPPAVSASPVKELPIHIDATSSRVWGGGQTWSKPQPKTVKSTRRRRG